MFSDPAFAPARRDDNPGGIDHFCLEVESATIDDLVAALLQAAWRSPRNPCGGATGRRCSSAIPTAARRTHRQEVIQGLMESCAKL